MTKKIKDAIYTKRYVYSRHYHIVCCTKYRNQIFTTEDLASEMKKLIIDTAASNDIQIEKLEVMPEHVHALIPFRPSKSISAVVKALKGHTGYVFLRDHPDIRKNKCWGGNLWSSSYYIGTVGNMAKDTVERYINDQIYNAKKDGKPYPSTH